MHYAVVWNIVLADFFFQIYNISHIICLYVNNLLIKVSQTKFFTLNNQNAN